MNLENRFPLMIVLCLALVNCGHGQLNKETQDNNYRHWTKEQKRKYFVDSIAYKPYSGTYSRDSSINNFKVFFKQMFPNCREEMSGTPTLYALGEEYVDTTQIDSVANWIRFCSEPSWNTSYCVILELKDGQSHITSKFSDSRKKYCSGLLGSSFTRTYRDSIIIDVINQLNELEFWSLGIDSSCVGGNDGATWYIEAMHQGNYNMIHRWCPWDCGNDTTIAIAELLRNIQHKGSIQSY